MPSQSRNDRGRFVAKSDVNREVRSLRLTNATWQRLGELANSQGMTRSDLIEQLVESEPQNQLPITGESSLQQVALAINRVLDDPKVTRNGRDRGSVRRALHALLDYLS